MVQSHCSPVQFLLAYVWFAERQLDVRNALRSPPISLEGMGPFPLNSQGVLN